MRISDWSSDVCSSDLVFTFHLRPGHRWSDGAPSTSEDFRYWWEDVAQNKEITPYGLDIRLQVDGEWPKVEFPDALTVRYSWSKPNPAFLPRLEDRTVGKELSTTCSSRRSAIPKKKNTTHHPAKTT